MMGKYCGGNKRLSLQETGISLLETLIALAILGVIAAVFLNGLAISSKTNILTDERSTAENLARIQMEWVKASDYTVNASAYTPVIPPVSSDYAGFATDISAEPVNTPDDGIQKITVTISHSDEQVFVLEGYKVDR